MSDLGLHCIWLARNIQELVAARAFAGIGGGGMTTVVSILLSDIIPLRSRGTWQGYVNVVDALGASTGAPLGGLLANSIGWRWAFIGQVPITVIASLAVSFILDLPKKADHSHWIEKLKRVDFLGAFTLISAVFLILFGFDRGSNIGWNDIITIATCCASISLVAIFVFVEIQIASHPFAPGHIIFQLSLFASYMCNFFSVGAYMGRLYYFPLYLQAVVESMNATSAGLRMIPPMVCSVSGSLFGGKVMQTTGRYYWLTVISLCFTLTGSIIVFSCSGMVINSTWGIIAGLSVSAFGGGCAIVTTLINVIANVDPKDQAIATACKYLFRSLGSVLGVSTAATVVQQSLRTMLRSALKDGDEADIIVDKVRKSLDYIKELDPSTKAIVIKCYQKANNAEFGVSLLIICFAFASSCFIREKRLK